MTSKVNAGKVSCQYGYDLRNRLASANITRKEGLQDVTITSSYTYNTSGIRTSAEQTINGITQNRYFLLDSGHTGYAQVFEETSSLGGNLGRSYVLGDDVLSQNVGGVTSHLLYDGHGSTRQLAGDDGAVTANYAYDAYGKMLGGNPNVTDRQSATDLLYAGEQFDPGLQMEYLRARYYDQNTGRFNRLDPFEGNNEDPQSLHKYAYAHCDPVNGIDPSGEMSLGEFNVSASIQSTLTTIATPAIIVVKNNMSTVARGAAFVCNLGQQVISKGGTIIAQGQRIANAAGEFIGRYRIDLLVRNRTAKNIMIEGEGVPWHLYKSATAWKSYLKQLEQQASAFKNATQTAGNVINERVITFSSKVPKGLEKARDDIYRVLGENYDHVRGIDDFIAWVDKL